MSANTLHVTVGRAFAGRNLAYIYVLYSKQNHVLYVGQTNALGGVFTRLGGHLDKNGTFRQRLQQNAYVEAEDIEDLQVFAFALPPLPQYISLDGIYREGIEYSLQKRLHTVRGEWNPYFRIISNVTAPDTTSLPEVRSLAQEIFDELERLYNT